MSGSERPDPRLGPLVNMALTYFSCLDALFKSYEPTLRGVARINSELATLAARRAQAWFDIPVALTKYKTPHDVFTQQVAFWQIAAGQYIQGSQRLVTALSACFIVPGIPQQGDKTTLPVRDYMTFSEPQTDPSEHSASTHGKRRAA
jgi:hypothetical protein